MKFIYYTVLFICSIFLSSCKSGGTINNNQTPMTTYAYITNEDDNSYTKCLVSKNGSLSGCYKTLVDTFNKPTDIQFHGDFAYVINNGNNSYTKCSILPNGELDTDNCIESAVNTFNSPLRMAFQNDHAYIVNHSKNSYTQCSVDRDGDLHNCIESSLLPNHIGLTDVAFQNGQAYFTAAIGHTIQCGYNKSNGDLTNCKNIIPSAIAGINGISFYNNQAYLGLDYNSEYSICTLNDSSSCALHKTQPITDTYNGGITFYNSTAYLLHSASDSYSTCNISNNGMLTSCTTNEVSEFNEPSAIAFHSVIAQPTPNPSDIHTHFYGLQTGRGEKNYINCTIANGGNLADCILSSAPASFSRSIVFNKNIAYLTYAIADFSKGVGYTKCYVNAINGKLSGCNQIFVTNPGGSAYENPFFEVNGATVYNNKVYMIKSDEEIESSGYATCNIDNTTGDLVGCNTYLDTIPMTYPAYISIYNNHAYITGYVVRNTQYSNSYAICDINDVDGTFNNCTLKTNDNFNRATNIIFNSGIAYIGSHSTSSNNSYTMCSIANDGTLVNCQYPDRISGLNSGVYQIAISENLVYITYDSRNYSMCQIGSDGLWENCVLNSDFFNDDSYIGPMAFYKYQI